MQTSKSSQNLIKIYFSSDEWRFRGGESSASTTRAPPRPPDLDDDRDLDLERERESALDFFGVGLRFERLFPAPAAGLPLRLLDELLRRSRLRLRLSRQLFDSSFK